MYGIFPSLIEKKFKEHPAEINIPNKNSKKDEFIFGIFLTYLWDAKNNIDKLDTKILERNIPNNNSIKIFSTANSKWLLSIWYEIHENPYT